MGRRRVIDHAKVKRGILEFLSPEKTAGMFLGYPTIRVYQNVVKFWKVRCSQKVVFNNLMELKEKGLVICKKSRMGHYYWKGERLDFFLDFDVGYDVELMRKACPRKQRENFDEKEAEKQAIENVKTRRKELKRLGYDLDESRGLFRDPLRQFRFSEIKDCSPDMILNGLEDAYRRVTPRKKKKRVLLKELEYIRREEKKKSGFELEEHEKGHRHWGKALPQMTMIFKKLLKELEEERG